jgi:hypothetical protein
MSEFTDGAEPENIPQRHSIIRLSYEMPSTGVADLRSLASASTTASLLPRPETISGPAAQS